MITLIGIITLTAMMIGDEPNCSLWV